MLGGLRLRPLGVSLAACTAFAVLATLVAAAPGGAATTTKEYAATFEPQCVMAPGVLNITAKLRVSIRSLAPEAVEPGESIELTQATSTITSPKELTESFVALGVHEVRGHVVNFVLDATNLEPGRFNMARPAEFPSGLPFFAPVDKEHPVVFNAPSLALGETGRTYSYGPLKVTGANGEVSKMTVDTTAGFEESTELGYKATGEGITSEIEGLNEKGEKVLGPIKVACTAPAGTVVAEIPIRSQASTTSSSSTTTSSTSSTTSSSSTTTATSTSSTSTTTATTSTSTTTSSTSTALEAKFSNWVLSGSLTVSKLKETVKLPSGCTFNGHATVPGALEGSTYCPAFKASLKVVGSVATPAGLQLTPSEAVKGTVVPGATTGDILIKAVAKEYISVTSVSEYGLTIPTSCKTVSPVSFPLEAEVPSTALASGATFKGQTTVPSYSCSGGLLGAPFGRVLTEKLSGANNPYTLAIEP